MKKRAIISTICYMVSSVSYVLSIVLRRGDTNPAVCNILLCVGSVFLLLGGFLSRRNRK